MITRDVRWVIGHLVPQADPRPRLLVHQLRQGRARAMHIAGARTARARSTCRTRRRTTTGTRCPCAVARLRLPHRPHPPPRPDAVRRDVEGDGGARRDDPEQLLPERGWRNLDYGGVKYGGDDILNLDLKMQRMTLDNLRRLEAPPPPRMTATEALKEASAKGLTLLRSTHSNSSTGYLYVQKAAGGRFQAKPRKLDDDDDDDGGGDSYSYYSLGTFATAVEAARCAWRSSWGEFIEERLGRRGARRRRRGARRRRARAGRARGRRRGGARGEGASFGEREGRRGGGRGGASFGRARGAAAGGGGASGGEREERARRRAEEARFQAQFAEEQARIKALQEAGVPSCAARRRRRRRRLRARSYRRLLLGAAFFDVPGQEGGDGGGHTVHAAQAGEVGADRRVASARTCSRCPTKKATPPKPAVRGDRRSTACRSTDARRARAGGGPRRGRPTATASDAVKEQWIGNGARRLSPRR